MSPDRGALYRGLSHAAWGYFFLHFDFNLGTVSIFPRFAGWLLLLSACGKLSGERRDLGLLRPLAALLAAWNGADWLLSWMGLSASGHILFLDLLIAVVVIYFHFQFLTDMAAMAERCAPSEGTLARRLRRRRTVYVVLIAAADILLNLPRYGDGEVQGYAALGLAFVALAAALFIMAGLFELRRCFREAPQAPQM